MTWSASGGSVSSSGLYTAPATAGTYTVTATSVANTSKKASSTVTVAGTAPTQSTYLLNVSPSLVNFGTINVGSTANQMLTLSNTGNSPVTVTGGNLNGSGFNASGVTVPFTVAAGASIGVTVSFTPQASGTVNGSISFASNATNSPATASLTGAGAASAPIAHSVALSWNASTSSVAGYNIYRGGSSGGPFSKVNASLQSGTNFTDANVTSGSLYYYYVTAVDSSGSESVPSNEINAQIPTP